MRVSLEEGPQPKGGATTSRGEKSRERAGSAVESRREASCVADILGLMRIELSGAYW